MSRLNPTRIKSNNIRLARTTTSQKDHLSNLVDELSALKNLWSWVCTYLGIHWVYATVSIRSIWAFKFFISTTRLYSANCEFVCFNRPEVFEWRKYHVSKVLFKRVQFNFKVDFEILDHGIYFLMNFLLTQHLNTFLISFLQWWNDNLVSSANKLRGKRIKILHGSFVTQPTSSFPTRASKYLSAHQTSFQLDLYGKQNLKDAFLRSMFQAGRYNLKVNMEQARDAIKKTTNLVKHTSSQHQQTVSRLPSLNIEENTAKNE